MPTGIPNRGSTCYGASIIQCIRATTGIEVPIHDIPHGPADAAEYLTYLIDRYPQIGREYEIGTKDGIHHILLVLPNGHGLVHDITYCHDNLIVQRDPSPIRIRDIGALRMGSDTFSLVAMVCSIPGHYYAIVKEDSTWYKCDDDHIEDITCTIQGEALHVYMMFYRILESQ